MRLRIAFYSLGLYTDLRNCKPLAKVHVAKPHFDKRSSSRSHSYLQELPSAASSPSLGHRASVNIANISKLGPKDSKQKKHWREARWRSFFPVCCCRNALFFF